ncbi:MBL fold metallo-hydrolase [Algicola sagamiensis]|uniref:MBL fold metallo-hydrolase n=1 Tax=Algicola sagamiensis TaxID=163869 RepID=UPI0003681154|nr:MBL fold metallo-hydrolase [Algicola sagamiensis]
MELKVIPVTAFAQNCSLIICKQTNQAAFVDPGGEPEKLKQLLKEKQVTLEKILLTHAHIDHVGAAKVLAEEFEVPIEGPHRDDQFWLDMLPQQAAMFQFDKVEAFHPKRWLVEGDTVKVGALSLAVYHCPGHTPGHVVFYQEAHQIVWVGDVLFQGSIGRTDFPMGDHQQLIDSIQKKLWPLGDSVTFIPGHGPTSTIGHEREHNPFVADKSLKQ